MNLAKASKVINVLKGDIADLKARITNSLTALDENEFDEDFNELWDELSGKITKLIDLKVERMEANVKGDMYKSILIAGEAKALFAFVNGLEIKKGRQVNRRYSYEDDKGEVFKCQLTLKDKLGKVAELQRLIIDSTDLLDTFNATTTIGD